MRKLIIKNGQFKGDSVVYVMSRDQRVQDNHALLAAQELAITEKVPLYVLFVLQLKHSRSREHYVFMLDGLKEVAADLQSHNISFIMRSGNATEAVTSIVKGVNCGALFFDFSPLRYARATIKQIAGKVNCPVTVVDTHNSIPLWVTSNKQEFAAHTIRRKVHQHLSKFLVAPAPIKQHPFSANQLDNMSFDKALAFIDTIPASGITISHKSGEKAARKHLEKFLEKDLDQYALLRNDIVNDHQSGLSPYLHFGQISSLRVAIETMAQVKQPPLLFEMNKLAQGSGVTSAIDGMNALLEEMIVRKELSDNFCFYNENYDSIEGAPAWAIDSLKSHLADPREHVYELGDWEACKTHDDIWNAAQMEMMKTGKMHGYLRMYWAKKILEWSTSPAAAIKTAVYLNDKYSIDGGDPNGYVGILWSIAGLHDRPWFERTVFGKIRFMNAAGLRRKYDVDKYIHRIKLLP